MTGITQGLLASLVGIPPANTAIPVISGTATVGSTLTSSTGTWNGLPVPTYTYQWQRGTTNISGATSSSYVVQSADAGNTLRCVVTATNILGSASATSANTATVTSGPVNTVLPTITGTAAVGSTLTSSTGTWTGTPTPTYTYQWQRGTSNISGATNSTYLVQSADSGFTLRCVVTATNSAGSASAASASTGTVASAPVNTSVPVISGSATVGSTLTSSTGTWTGTPTPTYAYQWQRGTTNISGATGSTYVVQSADNGSTLRCVVTATNSQGSASATSASTPAVTSGPVNTVAPTVSGTALVGQTLTSTTGTWTGTTPITYAYQWQRGTSNISGATSSTYLIQVADTGNTLRCVVTATNSVGSASAASANTAVVVNVIWTQATSGTTDDIFDILWTGSEYVAVGSAQVLRSSNGTSWTRTTVSGAFFIGVAWSGSLYVAVGLNGIIYTSPNATTWTSRTSGTTLKLTSVVWASSLSLFVVVGADGDVYTSPNGTTWTFRSTGTSLEFWDVAWSGSTLVAVGQNGVVYTSTNGTSWTSRTSGITNGFIFSVVWAQSQFVASGIDDSDSSSLILTSSNGTTWTRRTVSGTNVLRGIGASSSKYVAVGFSGQIRVSSNGTSWTTSVSGTTTNLLGVASSGTQFVIVGNDGKIFYGNP